MHRRVDRGMATAELAVVLPVVVLLLGVLLAGLGLAVDQVRCVDAARLGARAAARGDPDASVRGVVARAAPDGATIELSRSAGQVRVVVRGSARLLGSLVPESIRPSATAVSPLEVPGAPP